MSTPPLGDFTPLGPKKDKFTPELRILVASLLSMGVILLWAKYFGPKPPLHPPQPDKPAVSAPATAGTAANSMPYTAPESAIRAATSPSSFVPTNWAQAGSASASRRPWAARWCATASGGDCAKWCVVTGRRYPQDGTS